MPEREGVLFTGRRASQVGDLAQHRAQVVSGRRLQRSALWARRGFRDIATLKLEQLEPNIYHDLRN